MAIKKNDVIEIDFIAKVKDTGEIFDTSYKDIAEKTGINKEKSEPLIFPVGKGYVLKGLDESLIGKDIGEYTVEIPPEKGFGKKNVKLIKMIPLKFFLEKKIKPEVGMMYSIDGLVGVVKSVSSGRVIMDFNHPLAGKTLVYKIKINRIVENNKEKVEALLRLMGFHEYEIDASKKEIKVILPGKELPKEIIDKIQSEIEDITGIKEIIILSKDLLKPQNEAKQNSEKNKESIKIASKNERN